MAEMMRSGNMQRNTKHLLWDISGAFGDIGVLFPIAIALILKNGFNPTALFLMAGVFYIASAYYFKITMPVQPLKAMAAIAIASGLSHEVINAAGVAIGALLLFMALTGLSVKLGSFFHVSVIRGIQLGLGIMLIKSSLGFLRADLALAAVAALILVTSFFAFKKLPPLIPILTLGVVLSLGGVSLSQIGPIALAPRLPEMSSMWLGFTTLVLPQIALTFGNAIVATEATGKILYGKRAERLNLKTLPASMGIANIASGIIGGAPMCHGSGGLTAHCKFGAANERSGYIIGIALIALALVFGWSSLSLISAFPKAILGVLLCYVGIQHSLFLKDILAERASLAVALGVAAIGVATDNLSIGFLAGIGFYHALKVKKAVGASAA